VGGIVGGSGWRGRDLHTIYIYTYGLQGDGGSDAAEGRIGQGDPDVVHEAEVVLVLLLQLYVCVCMEKEEEDGGEDDDTTRPLSTVIS
jgi:hypothetical protein